MILVLGGTGEARRLAAALVAHGVAVTSSLLGAVARPRLPAGEVRIGRFGGPAGLAAWLGEHSVTAVVDATHPFASEISASAIAGCARAGVPLLRLQRPGWTARPGDDWTWADDLPAAATAAGARGRRIFLTTGRGGLEAFAGLRDPWFLIRCVDPPAGPLPPRRTVLLDRGPYTLESEGALLDTHRIDLLATKDSGGELTAAKLEAARARGIPVLLVRRPPRPDAETVCEVDAALAWALTVVR